MSHHYKRKSGSKAQRIQAGRTSTFIDNFVKEGWTSTANFSASEHKPAGLVVVIQDVSSSMTKVKECLSTSISACVTTMKVMGPALDHAVVTYTDYDQESLSKGQPVIEAPDTEGWTGSDFLQFFSNTNVRGGGMVGCEALNSALWYTLNDLVPAYKTRHGLTSDFPVLIFVWTDEDIRLSDGYGNYGKVIPTNSGYKCATDSLEECKNEMKLFKSRWSMDTPASASQFRNSLIANSCWMRVVKYNGLYQTGLEELCVVDQAYGSANDRWQLFLSEESSGGCHYSDITKFMVLQQVKFFKNLHHNFSSTAVLTKMSNSDLAEYMNKNVLEYYHGLNREQTSDFVDRFMTPNEYRMTKFMAKGRSSDDKLLLTNAYDKASSTVINTMQTWQLEQQQQTAAAINAVVDMVGGGNVAAVLMAHMNNNAAKIMNMDEIPLDERCGCKGCTKLHNDAVLDPAKQQRYVKSQWARMFAVKLFKPMLTERAMCYVYQAIPKEFGDIYDFVLTASSGVCTETREILSGLSSDGILYRPWTWRYIKACE